MSNAQTEALAAVTHALQGIEATDEQQNELVAYTEKVGIPVFMDKAHVLRLAGFQAFKQEFLN